MPITVQEINEKEFGETAFHNYKGYDVDTFLDYVADEVEILLNTNREQGERIAQYELRLKSIQQMEAELSRAVESSRSAYQDIIKNAQEKAATILAEARANADGILTETHAAPPDQAQAAPAEVPAAALDMDLIRSYVNRSAQELIALIESAVE